MPSFRGAEDLAEFIAASYPGRVVEVGAGHVFEVALHLKALGVDVTLTDKEERSLGELHVEGDDIFSPGLQRYQGARLLYSLRPPLEVQLAMGELAARLGADVLIRPLGGEIAELPGFSRRLVNAKEASFFLFRREP